MKFIENLIVLIVTAFLCGLVIETVIGVGELVMGML